MPADRNNTPQPVMSVWLHAARPRTLWVGVSPVIVGSSLAWHDGAFHLLSAVAALAGAVAIQIGTNFANDLYDFKHGADTPDRSGPLRVTQAGLVTPHQMQYAMWTAFGVAILVGAYLVGRGGWPILIAGLLSIAAGILYTGGPFPFGYHGLGEPFVFVFFGIVAVTGTYFVQAHRLTAAAFGLSIPMGLLAVAVLVVNNLRDIETDRLTGKTTLAVRLGHGRTRWEYTLVIAAAFLVPVILTANGQNPAGILLSLGAAVLAIPLVRTVWRTASGPLLNDALAQTARLQLVYGCLLAAGLLL